MSDVLHGRWTGSHLRASDVYCLLDIAKVTGSALDTHTAAAEVLELLRRAIPFAAASISAWNPITDRHETIANASYPEPLVDHLDTWFVERDEVFRYMRDVDPTPLRWQDMPFDYRRLHSARAYLMPSGFDEGVTTCLYTADGRYTGCLHVSTDTRSHPSDAAMDVLTVLQTALAGIPDALRATSWLTQALAATDGAVIIAPSGRVVTIPGRPADPDLVAGSPLITAVSARLGAAGGRYLWDSGDGRWRRIRLERLAEGTLVLTRPASLPHGVTPRELDVLTLLTEGYTTAEIAALLFVSVKTAGKHVEHLMEKLAVGSRTAAAARALAEGLILLTPPARKHDRRSGSR